MLGIVVVPRAPVADDADSLENPPQNQEPVKAPAARSLLVHLVPVLVLHGHGPAVMILLRVIRAAVVGKRLEGALCVLVLPVALVPVALSVRSP